MFKNLFFTIKKNLQPSNFDKNLFELYLQEHLNNLLLHVNKLKKLHFLKKLNILKINIFFGFCKTIYIENF